LPNWIYIILSSKRGVTFSWSFIEANVLLASERKAPSVT
jgi:hypothetical protein